MGFVIWFDIHDPYIGWMHNTLVKTGNDMNYMAVYNRWTGLLDWTTGLDYWTTGLTQNSKKRPFQWEAKRNTQLIRSLKFFMQVQTPCWWIIQEWHTMGTRLDVQVQSSKADEDVRACAFPIMTISSWYTVWCTVWWPPTGELRAWNLRKEALNTPSS